MDKHRIINQLKEIAKNLLPESENDPIIRFHVKSLHYSKYAKELEYMHRMDKTDLSKEEKMKDPIYFLAKEWHITQEEQDAWDIYRGKLKKFIDLSEKF